jgi:hypothetical protein
VWSTLSALRFDGDLQQAIADGYISRAMHPNVVHAFIVIRGQKVSHFRGQK